MFSNASIRAAARRAGFGPFCPCFFGISRHRLVVQRRLGWDLAQSIAVCAMRASEAGVDLIDVSIRRQRYRIRKVRLRLVIRAPFARARDPRGHSDRPQIQRTGYPALAAAAQQQRQQPGTSKGSADAVFLARALLRDPAIGRVNRSRSSLGRRWSWVAGSIQALRGYAAGENSGQGESGRAPPRPACRAIPRSPVAGITVPPDTGSNSSRTRRASETVDQESLAIVSPFSRILHRACARASNVSAMVPCPASMSSKARSNAPDPALQSVNGRAIPIDQSAHMNWLSCRNYDLQSPCASTRSDVVAQPKAA